MQEIQYTTKGNSDHCLFLIHGFCSGPEDWSSQIDYFSDKFTVLTPTLRGHDGTNLFDRPMSIEQLSNDCVAIFKEKKFKKVILAGHSMGTRLAIDIANKIENVYGIILVDGSRFADEQLYPDVINAFEKSIKKGSFNKVLEHMFSQMFFSEQFIEDKKRIIERALNIPSKYSLPLRRNALWYDGHCVDKNLKNLSLPILLLQSTQVHIKNGRQTIKQDEVIPYIDFIKSCASAVTIEKFENTGHYITLEKPQIINNIITKWIKSISFFKI